MKRFLVGCSVLALGVSSFSFYGHAEMAVMPVKSVDSADAEPALKVDTDDHYVGAVVDSAAHGVTLLNERSDKIAAFLEKEELEVYELEEIHELTYTMETSIDKIREEKAGNVAHIDALDEAIQAIHYASENHEEAVLREWFVKLQSSLKDLQAADVDSAPVKKDSYMIVIKDHKFSPAEIVVPAGVKIKLIVDNQDATPEEFESHDLNREKIIGGHKKATIYIGPLKAGKYHFFGEFNMDSANGYIIAK